MSSFETFQEPLGKSVFADPLEQADQIEVAGLEPGDLALSDDLAAGLEDSVRDALDLENAPSELSDDSTPAEESPEVDQATPPTVNPVLPLSGSGGGGW